MRRRLSDTRDGDAGVTLVELVIYILISTLVIAVVSAVFINGWRAQASTTDRDAATRKTSLVTRTLEQSIRNASSFSPSTGAGNSLVAVVATGSGATTWQCRAWVLTGGVVMYKSSNTLIVTTGVTPATAGWTKLATGVTGSIGTNMFSATSTTLTYGFAVAAGTASVSANGAVVAQAAGTGQQACW